jgi:hypothetical protein
LLKEVGPRAVVCIHLPSAVCIEDIDETITIGISELHMSSAVEHGREHPVRVLYPPIAVVDIGFVVATLPVDDIDEAVTIDVGEARVGVEGDWNTQAVS